VRSGWPAVVTHRRKERSTVDTIVARRGDGRGMRLLLEAVASGSQEADAVLVDAGDGAAVGVVGGD